jgi:hypothetical protein
LNDLHVGYSSVEAVSFQKWPFFLLWQKICIPLQKIMKKLWSIIIIVGLMSCNNGANDGDPGTDTTTMPVDTNLQNQTSDHINRADGRIQVDSSRHPDSLRK